MFQEHEHSGLACRSCGNAQTHMFILNLSHEKCERFISRQFSELSPNLEKIIHMSYKDSVVESSMVTAFYLIWFSNPTMCYPKHPFMAFEKRSNPNSPFFPTPFTHRRTPHFVINSVPKGYLMSNNALRQSVHAMQATGPHTFLDGLVRVFNYWTPGTMQKHPAMQYVSPTRCHRTNAVPLCPEDWE